MPLVQLEFRSELRTPPIDTWRGVTSIAGILAEMRPWLRMGVPAGLACLDDLEIACGRPLFRSRLDLFCLIPVGYSNLTLLEWHPPDDNGAASFIEESPMTGMKRWRHERRIEPAPHGSVLVDRLTFEPRWAATVVAWFVRRLFARRHAVLQNRAA